MNALGVPSSLNVTGPGPLPRSTGGNGMKPPGTNGLPLTSISPVSKLLKKDCLVMSRSLANSESRSSVPA